MAQPIRYPEHEKLKALGAKRDTVQEFIDWLYDTDPNWEIGQWVKYRRGDHVFEPLRMNREAIMAEFFGINLKRIDQEKDRMLAELRKLNS